MKSVLVIALILSMLLSTTVFAEVKTVEVKGYTYGMELTPEEIAQYRSSFSILNVKGIVGNVDVYGEFVDIYETDGPTKINLLDDRAIIYEVYKVTKEETDNGNIYNISDEIIKPSTGEAVISIPDETGKLDEYGYPLYVEKTITVTELEKYGAETALYIPGCTISLTEPGYYYVLLRIPAAAGEAHAFVKVSDSDNAVTEPEPIRTEPVITAPSIVTALPTSSKVLVNGKEVSFEAYNIEGNNYFKLRDVALAANGTEKQFGVEWDGVKQAVNLTSNSVYQTIGGEMAKGDGTTKDGLLNSSPIYKDGVDVKLKAYNINGNNYFKLRDLAQVFNIGVAWDNEAQTVVIDTTRSYTED